MCLYKTNAIIEIKTKDPHNPRTSLPTNGNESSLLEAGVSFGGCFTIDIAAAMVKLRQERKSRWRLVLEMEALILESISNSDLPQ